VAHRLHSLQLMVHAGVGCMSSHSHPKDESGMCQCSSACSDFMTDKDRKAVQGANATG
jgi:hypothetical protein